MKFLAPALIFCGAAAYGQSPQVPHKMEFAGLTLTIRDDARREIQKDVDALTAYPKYYNIKAERAKTYFPIIEKIFAEERLPDDFKYLALQESALIPDAVSISNAVGFWQFKDFTAREVGLRVDGEVDERMNIASASRGAARYLKQCNHYFNNWVYALQSYQMGAGGVMRSVGDKDIGVRHMEITSDTYWYVKKFLAHKIAFEGGVKGKPMIEVMSVNAAGRSWVEIAKETTADEQRLREFNKWLKTDRIPVDKEYALYIPKGDGTAEFSVLAVTLPTAVTAKATVTETAAVVVAAEKSEINGIPVIRANNGDTWNTIANRADVSLADLLRDNEIKIDQPVQAGALYFLDRKKKKASEELYTVKPGENLWTISQRFGVQQKSILKFNGLDPETKIAAGTTLYLSNKKPTTDSIEKTTEVVVLNEDDSFNWDAPVKRKTVAANTSITSSAEVVQTPDLSLTEAMEPETHEVKSTDTLYSVARQYGVTIKELMDWNEKKDFSLSVGEKLKVRSH